MPSLEPSGCGRLGVMTSKTGSSTPRAHDGDREAGGNSDTPHPEERRVTKGERTRERILVTAGRHFARNGYSAVTLRDIADDVGITPAMVVRYFGSKRALFEAVAHAESGELSVRRQMPVEERARRIIQYWQDPDVRTPMSALLRSLELDGGELFLGELERRVTSPLSELIHGE